MPAIPMHMWHPLTELFMEYGSFVVRSFMLSRRYLSQRKDKETDSWI
jgi:hypothetical protein